MSTEYCAELRRHYERVFAEQERAYRWRKRISTGGVIGAFIFLIFILVVFHG